MKFAFASTLVFTFGIVSLAPASLAAVVGGMPAAPVGGVAAPSGFSAPAPANAGAPRGVGGPVTIGNSGVGSASTGALYPSTGVNSNSGLNTSTSAGGQPNNLSPSTSASITSNSGGLDTVAPNTPTSQIDSHGRTFDPNRTNHVPDTGAPYNSNANPAAGAPNSVAPGTTNPNPGM